MSKPWDVVLSIDSVGPQDAQVRIGVSGANRTPHVNVRVGSLLVHCLDPASVMSVASAWAAAEVRIGGWLPTTAPPRPSAAPGFGAAYPVGSVIFEGRQPWTVSTAGDGLTVTFGCVRVAVRDRAALETNTRAWREASAISAKLYPGRAVPYGQLLRRAQITSIQRAAGEQQQAQRPTGRERA